MSVTDSLSLQELIDGINNKEYVKRLKEGMQFHKIRGVDKKTEWYKRHLYVDMDTLDSLSLVTESRKWLSSGEKIPLMEIIEIRSGWKTDIFNEIGHHIEEMRKNGNGASELYLDETCCFSVVHGAGGRETLDLLASSAQVQKKWVDDLNKLTYSIQNLFKDRKHDLFVRGKFNDADINKNEFLSFEEISKLLKNLNIQMDIKKAKQLFDDANTNKTTEKEKNSMNQDEFLSFYNKLLKTPEIEKLFMKYANKRSELLSINNLQDFLKTEQGFSDITLKDATEVDHASDLMREFEIYRPQRDKFMSLNAFYHMLLSPHFNLYNHMHQTVHNDMTRPLSHYYINSSHNTYLTGNQITSKSSVEGYISALQSGCKVLELDIWNGEDGNPMICHAFKGYTMTSKLPLKDLLQDAIKPYAFHVSRYPVILSCENHLSTEQQLVMVNMFKDILGDMIALPKDFTQDFTKLPSPEDLKGKVIIKAKISEDEDLINKKQETEEKEPAKLIPELKDIVGVLVGKKYKDEQTGEVTLIDGRYRSCHMPSLEESKARELIQNNPNVVTQFTQNNLLKVYPVATRVGSSNCEPYPFWSVGVQIVTLNKQNEDEDNFYNHALFWSNGNCGYVLKPNSLTNPAENISSPKSLCVTILSGQHLPEPLSKYDILDPYVQVKVRGDPKDYLKQRTSTVSNNGFNPVWNESLDFKVNIPDVALIYFAVRDESTLRMDPVLAVCCIPFHSLQTGYRHVHLTELSGEVMAAAKLFVHIEIQD